MYKIAISNQKGGVGKTTTAINLSVGLSLLGKRVLLVDLDPQANATTGLGFLPSEEKSIYSCFSGNSITDRVLKTNFENLHLVSSDINLAGAESEIILQESNYVPLKEILDPIKDHFDFCFFDTPPSLGILMTSALSVADEIFLPLQAEWFSLEGLAKILHLIDKIRTSEINPNLALEGILLTMFQKNTNISKQVFKEVKNYFPEQLYNTFIPRSIKLAEAPSFGKSIFDYLPSSPAGKAYKELAEEFLARHSDI